MMRQYTFSMIKPDATYRNITGKINSMIEDAGFEIIRQEMRVLSEEEAKMFYYEHKDRPFYQELVDEIISGRVVLQIIAGENGIEKYRDLMGITDPKKAAAGTIRAKYGISIGQNSIHGSDSFDSAAREIRFFFKDFDI